MSALRRQLQELIGNLPEERVAPVLALIQGELTTDHAQRRTLSFAGTLHSGVGDLAARSEEILRTELGRPA